MTGLQALDFYALKSSKLIEKVKKTVRAKVPFLEKDERLDRFFEEIVGLFDDDSLLDAANI